MKKRKKPVTLKEVEEARAKLEEAVSRRPQFRPLDAPVFFGCLLAMIFIIVCLLIAGI
jgi:hypothetical protein